MRSPPSKYMIKYMAVAVAVAVSGGVAVPVAVPGAGLAKRFFIHPKRFLIQCLGLRFHVFQNAIFVSCSFCFVSFRNETKRSPSKTW